jgi:DNA-binding transcriptional LysR family regulator
MDRITALAAFVRTVELGSQAAASEDLGLSRAMIGRHIQQLEDRLESVGKVPSSIKPPRS